MKEEVSNDDQTRFAKLYPYVNGRAVCFYSKSPFFVNYVKLKVEGDVLIFKLAGIDDRKTRKAHLVGGYYRMMITADLPPGKYRFDEEESDSDTIVIYCREGESL